MRRPNGRCAVGLLRALLKRTGGANELLDRRDDRVVRRLVEEWDGHALCWLPTQTHGSNRRSASSYPNNPTHDRRSAKPRDTVSRQSAAEGPPAESHPAMTRARSNQRMCCDMRAACVPRERRARAYRPQHAMRSRYENLVRPTREHVADITPAMRSGRRYRRVGIGHSCAPPVLGGLCTGGLCAA